MESTDDFQAQATGSLLAVRIVVTALVRTHPAPEQLLYEIKSLMDTHVELKQRLPDPIEKAFDERLHEFASHVYARMSR
jgi:hypothetical protein